jgi:hypothetical protein
MPKPATPEPPKVPAWTIDQETLTYVKIQLPRENKSEAFLRGSDNASWFFDDAQQSAVDHDRWGGVPLLLSRPTPERLVAENANAQKLTDYGLTQPSIELTLKTDANETVDINIGDLVPDKHGFYAQVPGSNNVAVVDVSWYNVVQGLVEEPPYASPQAPQ